MLVYEVKPRYEARYEARGFVVCCACTAHTFHAFHAVNADTLLVAGLSVSFELGLSIYI